MNQDKISLCLTVYNRPDMVIESFRHVIDDERIGEIVISDDCSTPGNFAKMKSNLFRFGGLDSKIDLTRSRKNLGVYDNKRCSVGLARLDYCIILDSDNIITPAYLDKVFAENWAEDLILAPDFARPSFCYRDFRNITFDQRSVPDVASKNMFACLLNTMNYFVNRRRFLDVWEPAPGILGADSIHFNYLWLKSGGRIKVVEGLEYFHRIHEKRGEECGSNYVNFADQSEPLCRRELEAIKNLSGLAAKLP